MVHSDGGSVPFRNCCRCCGEAEAFVFKVDGDCDVEQTDSKHKEGGVGGALDKDVA